VKNANYRLKSNITKNRNFAYQIAAVEELQNSSSDFIKMVIKKPEKVPYIIFYTENQKYNIARFCFSRPTMQSTVLGIDKTYNLSVVHVTATLFKNLSLLNRNTLDYPIFLRPLFFHGNSDVVTFF